MPSKGQWECDLAKPVAKWLRAEGYTVYSEIAFWHRCIDMVGLIEPLTLRIVELKLRFASAAVKQAMVCQLATKDVYLAVGNTPNDASIELCARSGIGLLRVGAGVDVLLTPRRLIEPGIIPQKHLIENCLGVGPSDVAGLPSIGGNGPAQFVGQFVKEYVKQHPRAGWREIYDNVANHYSNYRSMAGAMTGYLHLTLTKMRNE